MKRITKLITIILVLCMVFSLCSCTKTVENEKMTLDLNGIGERKGTYTGEIKDDIPNGSGKFITKNSSNVEWYYEGDWVNGQMEGEGMQVWEELGQKHEGLYKDGNYEGEGKWYEDNTLVYQGNFSNGLYDGEGKLFNSKEKTTYEGSFKEGHPTDIKQLKKVAIDVDYNSLARNEHDHLGDIVCIKGEIVQVMEGDNGYAEYRLSCDEFENEVVYLTYQRGEGEDRIIENDKLTVYGISKGLYTYESTLGSEITVPSIDVLYK